jgi:EAL domain-containing protein (putative c-di-GMP-specific phosphodiesterase class I)
MSSMIERLSQPGALRIEFQPIVTVAGDNVELYALEALSRGPRGTNMERPDVLFEYARRKGRETELDFFCMVEIMRAAATLPGSPLISINVHGSTIAADGFAESFLRLAAASNVAADRVMLEILEHDTSASRGALRANLADLRSAGVRIALDDFGVGSSNFRRILDFRPDHLKIDRHVVLGCSRDPWRMAILRSFAALAEACWARPIAEGVEEAADLEVLLDFGIDTVQGWLYSRSMTPCATARSPFLNPQSTQQKKGVC